MSIKKILYLCFNYPYPPKMGEEHGFSRHINELALSNLKNIIDFIFINTNNNLGKFPYSNLKYKIFDNKIVYKNKLVKQLLYFFYILFNKCPKNFDEIISSDYISYIENQKADIVILDSIYSFKMLPKHSNYKLIYIAHNIEQKLYKDVVTLEHNFFKKVYKYLYLFKIKHIENYLLKKADCIVSISTSDYNYLKQNFSNKTLLYPYRINITESLWENNKFKTLFFCGPIGFAPNYDAIKWIAEKLAPILSKDIIIKIAGKDTTNVPNEWKKDNIEYLGFVSRNELLDLYKKSNAFLCPIIYGSGIKIKVTEALSFGMPIIATKESLEGLDYLDIMPLIDRNDLQKTKENIENLLNNSIKLQNYSDNLISQVVDFQKNNNVTLESIIREVINE